MTRGTVTNKQTGLETQESNSHLASYAVESSVGQIAWFVIEEDAESFIASLHFPERYRVVELTYSPA